MCARQSRCSVDCSDSANALGLCCAAQQSAASGRIPQTDRASPALMGSKLETELWGIFSPTSRLAPILW